MNTLTGIFKKELFVIAGLIGIELYGLYFAVSAFCLLIFLAIVDTMLGYYIAHRKGIVSSRIGADGLMKKVIWIMLLAGAIVFLGNMASLVEHEMLSGFLSIAVMVVIMFRLLFEMVSLVENLAVISSEDEKTTLAWISGMLMKIVGIGKEQIERKIGKYK